MEERFIKFLKKHGVYGKYLHNIKNTTHVIKDSRDYLYEAFTWDDTTEGHDYWSELNRMWNYELYKQPKSTEQEDTVASQFAYTFPQHDKSAVLSHYLHRGDKIYLSEVLSDSTLPKTAVVDELIHGNGYVEVYLR